MKNLNRLYWLKKDIKDIEEKIKGLTMLKAAAMTGMPGAKNISSPVEKYVERIERLEEKLAHKRMELIAETERIESIIESIEDDEIRLIARMRFIDHMGFQKIGEKLFIDRTTAAKKLKRYLEREKNEKTFNSN